MTESEFFCLFRIYLMLILLFAHKKWSWMVLVAKNWQNAHGIQSESYYSNVMRSCADFPTCRSHDENLRVRRSLRDFAWKVATDVGSSSSSPLASPPPTSATSFASSSLSLSFLLRRWAEITATAFSGFDHYSLGTSATKKRENVGIFPKKGTPPPTPSLGTPCL